MKIDRVLTYKLTGIDIICTIEKELLSKNASSLSFPYFSDNGSDVKTLCSSLDVIDSLGISNAINAFQIRYDSRTEKAELLVDWSKIVLTSNYAVINIKIKGKYDFERDFGIIINYKQKHPIAIGKFQFVKDERIWGCCESIGVLCIDGTANKGESWMYANGNSITVRKDFKFELLNESAIELWDEKTYKRSMRFDEKKDFPVYFDFGTEPIEQKQSYTFSYSINNGEWIDVSVEFSPNLKIDIEPTADLLYVGEEYKDKEVATITFTNIASKHCTYVSQTIQLEKNIKLDDSAVGLLGIKWPEKALDKLDANQSQSAKIILNGLVGPLCGDELSYTISCGNITKNQTLTLTFRSYGDPPIVLFKERKPIIYPVIEDSVVVGSFHVSSIVPMVDIDITPRSGEKIVLIDETGDFTFDNKKQEIDVFPREHVVRLNARSRFNVPNLIQDEVLYLKYKYISTTPISKVDSVVRLTIHPYDAKPQLLVTFTKDNNPIHCDLENNECEIDLGLILFSCSQIEEDISLLIGTLSIANNQAIPYLDRKLQIRELRINDDGGILFPIPEEMCAFSIPNGGPAQSVPVMINWGAVRNHNNRNNRNMRLGDRFSVTFNAENNYTISFKWKLEENRNNYWYSLDLGTTGIVMACMVRPAIYLIPLRDALDHNIEPDPKIISSIMILKKDDDNNNVGKLILSPDIGGYRDASFVLAPIKFIIGQSHLPFISEYQEKFNSVKWVDRTLPLNELTPDTLVKMTYQDIFSRFKPSEQMQRLIITYPNTYTPEQIDKISNIIEPTFPVIKGHLYFVPESDAVVAYYIGKRMQFEQGFNDTERILIYDMGAGTLDLSYLIVTNEKDVTVAKIERKIGIPIAGNYLDYLIYESVKYDIIPSEDILETQKNAKEAIGKNIKPNLKECNSAVAIKSWDSLFRQESVITVSNVLENQDVQKYLEICTDRIFELLIGRNWSEEIDTIVFSGRGSQFAPLRTHIAELMPNCTTDSTTITTENLKTCVAEGAIKYMHIFSERGQYPYRIENRNQYGKIGVVYCAFNEKNSLEVHYEVLIDPIDNRWVEEGLLRNGTRFRRFQGNSEIDLRYEEAYIYFIQTLLDEKRVKELYQAIYEGQIDNVEDMDWCFINELFKISSADIYANDRKNVKIEVSIDENNRMTRRIQDREMRNVHVVEEIENNKFYINGAWPFSYTRND